MLTMPFGSKRSPVPPMQQELPMGAIQYPRRPLLRIYRPPILTNPDLGEGEWRIDGHLATVSVWSPGSFDATSRPADVVRLAEVWCALRVIG